MTHVIVEPAELTTEELNAQRVREACLLVEQAHAKLGGKCGEVYTADFRGNRPDLGLRQDDNECEECFEYRCDSAEFALENGGDFDRMEL